MAYKDGWFADRAPLVFGVGSGYIEALAAAASANKATFTASLPYAISASGGWIGVIFDQHTHVGSNLGENGVKIDLPSTGYFSADAKIWFGTFSGGHAHPQSRIYVDNGQAGTVTSREATKDGNGGQRLIIPRTAITTIGTTVRIQMQGADGADSGFFSMVSPSYLKVYWTAT